MMFNAKELARIAALEAEAVAAAETHAAALAEVESRASALAVEVAELKSAHEREKGMLVDRANEALRQQAANDQAKINAVREEAIRTEGMRDEARHNADKVEMRLRTVLHNHDWRKAGRAISHGAEMELWECVVCKADPMANARILVPPGFMERA